MTDPTTFSLLMERAALALDHAVARDAMGANEGAWAHGAVVGALNHLHQTLGRTALGKDAAHEGGPALDARSARNGRAELPAESPAHDLLRAAQLIHAAADLWSTHQSPTGSPRSPEAARMAHPSVLGAAMRRWRDLAAKANTVAAAVDGRAICVDSLSADSGCAQRPKQTTRDPLAIPVARPPLRAGGAPLDELSGRIAALRHYAWHLSERQVAPAVVLRNLAEVGVLVSRGSLVTCAPGRKEHWANPPHRGAARCAGHDRAAEAWCAVRRSLSPIRSAHPATHVIQVELMQVARRVEEVLVLHRRGAKHDEVCLSQLAAALNDVALYSARAVRRAHSRGDLYVTGRGIPGSLASKHPDLLRAKLEGGIVPAPTAAVRQVLRSYRDVLNALPVPTGGMRVA